MTINPTGIDDEIWDERIAPWNGANEKLIRYAHRHVYAVQAYDAVGYFPLEVTACRITYDAGWSPYVQGTMTIRRPDAATIARLNPRLKVRFVITAGYVLPGAVLDWHPIATRVWLSHRTRNIADDTLTLQFQGGEYLVDSIVTTADFDGPQDTRGGWDDTLEAWLAIGDVLDYTSALGMTGGDYDVLGTATSATGWVPPGDPWTGRAGENSLAIAREVCTRTNLWLRCTEFGDWALTPVDVTAGGPVHELRDGADGTIIDGTHDLSREQWANDVTVVHNWTRPTGPGAGKNTLTEYSSSGQAWIDSGPFAVAAVGRVSMFIQRDTPSSFALTRTEAANILARYQRNIGTYDVDSVAAYWLRPGVNVNVSVDGEDPVLYGVQAVTFDLDAGRMTSRVRQPGTPEVIAMG